MVSLEFVARRTLFLLRRERNSMLQMLDHGAAGFGTVPARFGAIRHVLVVLEFLALLCTIIARFRASVARRGREWALPGGQFGRQRAVFGAIDARVHRLDVLLFSARDESRAVVKTSIARYLTIGASFGALREMLMVRIGLISQRLDPVEGGEPAKEPQGERHIS
jgi:hypothetical protein